MCSKCRKATDAPDHFDYIAEGCEFIFTCIVFCANIFLSVLFSPLALIGWIYHHLRKD